MLTPVMAKPAFTLTVYVHEETGHVAVNVAAPTPITTTAQKQEVARLVRKALEKLEDHVAWNHLSEIVTERAGS